MLLLSHRSYDEDVDFGQNLSVSVGLEFVISDAVMLTMQYALIVEPICDKGMDLG